MSKKNFKLKILLSLALGSELFYLIISAIEDLRSNVPLFLFCYGLIFLLYLAAIVLFYNQQILRDNLFLQRYRWVRILNEEKIATRELLSTVLLFGLIFRLTLLFITPTLSDDIYRYVWDGKVASQGINPYQYPPNADELSPIQDEKIYPKINHKEISTIYPPTSQLLFWGLFKLDPSIIAFKAAFVGLDLLTLIGIYLILKHLGLSLYSILIYAWNPLIITEIAGNGHADSLGICLLVFSLWLLLKRKFFGSTFLLVFSFLTKFISIIFWPFLLFKKKDNRFALALLFVIFSTLLYLPYADAGEKLFSGLMVYTDKWRFNDSIFFVIYSGVEKFVGQDVDYILFISKRIIAAVFAAVFVYFLIRFKKDLAKEGEIWLFRLGILLFGAFILLSPTVHPWYLCWLVPFLTISPQRAWLMLTGLVAISYWILIEYSKTGIWQQSGVIRGLEYLPFYALLIYDFLKAKFIEKRVSF